MCTTTLRGLADDGAARAQQLHHDLETNLDARTRHEGDAAAQVRRLQALAPVELGAGWAKGAVKVVQLLVPRLARVAGAEGVPQRRRGLGGG
jgi:hypothetical protein